MKSLALCLLAACAADPSVPLAADSPWPKFRHDARQIGRSDIRPTATTGQLWAFQTGKGIFSSPVVAGDGTIYVGSADRTFYALNPDGSLRWSNEAGEIIDSAALLDDRGRVYSASGDGHLRAFDAETGDLAWDFAADAAVSPAIINWFEGNVAIGPDGTLYAGNDNFKLYAIDREGNLVDRIAMPDQTWSLPAIDPASGALTVGNNSLLPVLGANVLAFDHTGTQVWNQRQYNGSVAASPLLAEGGLVVIGGFDGFVRGLDAKTGMERWELGTRDHIYASAAEAADGTIIQPSTDGTVYAIDPATGAVRWQYDTVEPIRSSPAIDGDGNIYFGSGDGRLYVLNPDGMLRWSLLLITDDRNDLNASPALGSDAVYLAGESGQVFSVPYDYCLRASDPHCDTVGDQLPAEGAVLRYTTGLGSPLATPPAILDANQPVVLSLFVRAGGATQLGLIDTPTLAVDITPAAAVTTSVSSDRRFVVITPTTGFTGDSVQLHVHGNYLIDLDRDGLVFTGGTTGGTFDQTFTFALSAPASDAIALQAPVAGSPASSFELYRLAAPLPTMLPSYNQIGFDSLHYLLGVVEPGVAWVIGAQLAADGTTVPDPATHGTFALAIDYHGGLLTLDNEAGFSLEAMGATLTFDSFRVSTRLDANGATTTEPQLAVSSVCSSIQLYGPFLAMLGLCNPQSDQLIVSGGLLLRPHGDGGVTTAPTGVGTASFAVAGKVLTVTMAGSAIDPTQHAIGVLLVDATTGAPVSLGYGLATAHTAAADGTLATVTLALTGSEPAAVRAYLMVDTYPAAMAAVTLH